MLSRLAPASLAAALQLLRLPVLSAAEVGDEIGAGGRAASRAASEAGTEVAAEASKFEPRFNPGLLVVALFAAT